MAINMPIQGTAADGIKIAMVRLHGKMQDRRLHSRMLLQVHDELVFETDAEELPLLAELAREVMEGALPLDPPLEVDFKVGENWQEMDKYLREDGAWQRVPKSSTDVAREAAEEETVAELVG
jgi:DNA polymerase-1